MKNQSSTGAVGAGSPVDGIWQAMEQASSRRRRRIETHPHTASCQEQRRPATVDERHHERSRP